MRTASRKHNFYGMVAISIILLICSSLMYKYLIQQKYPSHTPKVSIKQQFHSPAIDHTACGIKSRRVQRRAWSLLDINVTSSLPLPRVGSYQCRDQICSEFLSVKDRITIHKCHHDKCQKFPIKIAPKCHFMNGTHRSPVALVSFPGSGNTWVRGLLEKATGICTGCEYCDNIVRNSGAIGEGVSSGSVIVVKTHRTRLHFNNTEGYRAAILLLRNPFQAMVSEWNRRLSASVKRLVPTGSNSHVASLPEKYFGNNKEWQTFVAKYLPVWKRYIFNLLLSNDGSPVLTVCYEDVLRNSIDEVKRMLDFLQVPYSNSCLKKTLAEDYNTFHRNHTSTFEPFTESQKKLVRSGINDILLKLKQRKKTIPGLKKYLASTVL